MAFLGLQRGHERERKKLLDALINQIEIRVDFEVFQTRDAATRLEAADLEFERLCGVANQIDALYPDNARPPLPQCLVELVTILKREITRARAQLSLLPPSSTTSTTVPLPSLTAHRERPASPESEESEEEPPTFSDAPEDTGPSTHEHQREDTGECTLTASLAALATTTQLASSSTTYIPTQPDYTARPPPNPTPYHLLPSMAQQGQQQPAQVAHSRLNDIKFPLPLLFEGKREQVKRWQTSVRSFLDAHDRANLPDEFQVLFALSRVSDEGAVGVWKENWLNAHTGGANPGYGNLAQFFLEFAAAFTATTSTQEAMRKIKALKMGGRSTDEHTAQFELLVDQAGLATASGKTGFGNLE